MIVRSKGERQPRAEKRAVSLPTLDTAPAQWLRSIRLSGFTIVALVLIVLTVVVLAPNVRILVEQRQEVAALQAQVDQAESDLDELAEQRARWDDPSYIQSQARERLDYVYPGEFTFLVVDDGQTVVADDGLPISEDIQTTDVDWVSSMLSSLLTAGLTQDAAGDIVAPSLGGQAPGTDAEPAG
ncbi:MAG: hypothetical protein RI885_17 [Actinomycetota bacterium]